jgi:hypothetical protein
MVDSPWQSHSRAAPERDYVALLSYLPLNSGWSIPRLLLYNARIRRQLRLSAGLVGCSRRQAVLDTLRMGGRDGAAGVRRGAAACRRHEGAGSAYGRDALHALDREGV